MASRSRLLNVLTGTACLSATVVMAAAAFLPFTGFDTDGLVIGDHPPDQITMSIVGGSDVWFVVGTLATLGIAAVCHVAGVRNRISGIVALAASLAALGLALKLPGTWNQAAAVYGQPYVLDSGFYVFLGGAVAAVISAVLMVAIGLLGSALKAAAPMHPSPS